MTALLLAVVLVGVATSVLDERRRTRDERARLAARLERDLAGLHGRWSRPAAAAVRRRVALRRIDRPVTWQVVPWPAPSPGWRMVA